MVTIGWDDKTPGWRVTRARAQDRMAFYRKVTPLAWLQVKGEELFKFFFGSRNGRNGNTQRSQRFSTG
jgi:hypothetical protein